MVKYALNYIYAKYQVYLIIFCLIMPNHSLLFGIFHKYLIIKNTCTVLVCNKMEEVAKC